jgi:ParB family chromosome partitioning protein
MSRRALGRGIDALFQTGSQPATEGGQAPSVIILPLDRIQPAEGQPRKTFDEGALRELAESIRRKGVLQPVIVTPADGDLYTLVAGERRWRAARLAGLSSIPAVVRRAGERERLEIALIENLQREDLDPIEEARAYGNLMELSGASQEEVARLVGKDRSTVANSLRLLRLPEESQRALIGGELSPGHARAILSVSRAPEQQTLLRRILAEGLTVRQAEELAARIGQKARPHADGRDRARKKVDPTLADLERRLFDRLGTKVEIKGDRSGGRFEISYFSREDLDRIAEILLGR